MSCMNNEKKGYRDFELCDSHTHIAFEMPIETTERMLDVYMTYFGLGALAILALPHSSRAGNTDPSNNLKALFLKAKLNRLWPRRSLYALGGLYHFFDGRDTPQGFERQARALCDMGFDGLKVLTGKPELRARLGEGLDGGLLRGVWRFCEEKRFPVTMHLGDPIGYWQSGVYGADMPALEQLRSETERVLESHPGLDIVLCHFYFMADDLERLDRFMARFPNVGLDLTPGSEMYFHFTQRPGEWRDFFIRHQSRIFFGTDSDNWDCPKRLEDCETCFSYPFNLVRNALEGRQDFCFEDHDYGPLSPLHLPDDALSAIYGGNFHRRFGSPRQVDMGALRLLCGKLLSLYEHDALKECSSGRWETDRRSLARMYDWLDAREDR